MMTHWNLMGQVTLKYLPYRNYCFYYPTMSRSQGQNLVLLYKYLRELGTQCLRPVLVRTRDDTCTEHKCKFY